MNIPSTSIAPGALRRRAAAGLAALRTPGPRMVDELECAASVLLAIAFGHAFGAHNVSWAAVSGYMVMRGHVADSLLRGLLRIVGTGAGAALAWWLVPRLAASLPAASLAGFVVGGATLYAAITAKRSYAWLFVGLTFEMILLDVLERPSDAVGAFASTRVVEVAAGTAACVLVSTLSTLTARRRWPGERMPRPVGAGWHPHAFRHAVQGALALALLPLLWSTLHLPELSQSSVTVMAAMLIPVASLGPGRSGLAPVSRRLAYRAVGCLAGSALAALVLVVAHGSAWLLIAGACVGVVIGRHIENGRTSVAYVGTQFVLAVLVVLVPDPDATAHLEPALERLAGVLVGLAVLEPVLVAWHLAARLGRSTP